MFIAKSHNQIYSFISRIIAVCLLIISSTKVYSQESKYKDTSIKVGMIGFGKYKDNQEYSLAGFTSLGWQKNLGKNSKFDINPNLGIGIFNTTLNNSTFDSQDYFYPRLILDVNVDYHLLTNERMKIVTSLGVAGMFSNGFVYEDNQHVKDGLPFSKHQHAKKSIFGSKIGIALRITSKDKSKEKTISYNVYIGNKQMLMAFLMFTVNFKFKEKL